MFRSRTTRRRNQTDSSARARRPFISRRLRVELMEGRLMLSATALNALASPAENPLAVAHVSLVAKPAEGGFINTNVESPATRSYGRFSATGEVASVLSDVGVSDQMLLGGASQGLFFNSYSPIDVNELQPVAMTLSSNGAVFQPTLIPIVAGSTGSTPGPSEGGSIPIYVILADLRSDVSLASNGKSISSLAAEKSVDSAVSARRVSTSDSAIAGEWARAMVFEIAGGEPGANGADSLEEQPGTTTRSEEMLQRNEPLSSVDRQHDEVTLATRQEAAAQAGEGSTGNQQGKRPLLTAASPSSISAALQMAAGGEQSTHSSVSNDSDDLGKVNRGLMSAPTAVAFDQFGEGNAAVIESTVDGKSWLRSIGTSPLLMVLALERIAALNSRRATRESRVAVAKMPLRLRS